MPLVKKQKVVEEKVLLDISHYFWIGERVYCVTASRSHPTVFTNAECCPEKPCRMLPGAALKAARNFWEIV